VEPRFRRVRSHTHLDATESAMAAEAKMTFLLRGRPPSRSATIPAGPLIASDMRRSDLV
jgi:hypothetical protein